MSVSSSSFLFLFTISRTSATSSLIDSLSSYDFFDSNFWRKIFWNNLPSFSVLKVTWRNLSYVKCAAHLPVRLIFVTKTLLSVHVCSCLVVVALLHVLHILFFFVLIIGSSSLDKDKLSWHTLLFFCLKLSWLLDVVSSSSLNISALNDSLWLSMSKDLPGIVDAAFWRFGPFDLDSWITATADPAFLLRLLGVILVIDGFFLKGLALKFPSSSSISLSANDESSETLLLFLFLPGLFFIFFWAVGPLLFRSQFSTT